jgi:hypothetical protein
MSTALTLNTHNADMAKQFLIGRLSQYDRRRALFSTRSFEVTSGIYGTESSIAVLEAITQASVTTIVALRDGAQLHDLARIPELYPVSMKVITNWKQAKLEFGELNFPADHSALVLSIFEQAQGIAQAFAQGNTKAVVTLTQDQAYKAVLQSLDATRETILLGFKLFRTGFDLSKIPSAFQLFPHIALLANNAPAAVQGWSMLTRSQQFSVYKFAIDIVDDILTDLESKPVVA